MTTASPQNRELYLELLAAKALDDLSRNEVVKLEELAPLFPEIDAEEMARLTASIQLALTPTSTDPLPTDLRERVMADADAMMAPQGTPPIQPQVHRLGVRESFAWFAATAAALLALLGWLGRPGDVSPLVRATPAEMRRDLMAGKTNYLQVSWNDGKHPFATPVTGDVVWSTPRQEGYMLFNGLPVNNPSQQQYQLWIIDPERDEEPIDGGVFDVTSSGTVVVPINPKLGVVDPKAFAITVEKPGGVVVSTQENLPLIAAVP